MSCSLGQEQLALYSGGDLTPVESRTVCKHLNECVACRETLANLRLMAEFIADAQCEPDNEDLRCVRFGVMQAVRTRQRSNRFLQVAVGTAMILISLLGVIRHQPGGFPKPATITNSESLPLRPLPSFSLSDLSSVAPVSRPRHGRRIQPPVRNVALTTRPEGSAELRLATSDPNVVILVEMNEYSHDN